MLSWMVWEHLNWYESIGGVKIEDHIIWVLKPLCDNIGGVYGWGSFDFSVLSIQDI